MAERELVVEEPLELRRNLDALRRGRMMIVLLVLIVTGTVIGVSFLLPKAYNAHATVVLQDNIATFGARDVETVKRGLQTFERLLGTNHVLASASAALPGETLSSLRSKVSASVDPDANVITISARDDTARRAAEIANAVARTFLTEQAALERRGFAVARKNLAGELSRLRAAGGNPDEVAALQSRITELTVDEVNAGSELQLAQAAEPPSEPYTPRPLRNGVLAFFGSAFVAVLVALGRDRLAARVGSARELSRFLNVPIVAWVPYVRRRLGRRRRKLLGLVVEESYKTLQSSIRFELPPDQQRVILVTSAVDGEGKTSLVAGLGRALARVGQRTLVVSADLRVPKLHELFDSRRGPGFADALVSLTNPESPLRATLVAVGPNLDLMPSGTIPSDPSALMLSDAVDQFFSLVAELDYSYVLVDGPPLLGVADSHSLARRAGSVLLVARLERLTLEDVAETRDVLDRLQVVPLGLVVVGSRRPHSYAYVGAGLLEELHSGR
jgi:capsular exopolysaccharide synthesis family protein